MLLTLLLVLGLVGAFIWALYLSNWGGINVRNAFRYQSAVVAAQRDAELLAVEQFERRSKAADLGPYAKLLDSDLTRIDKIADSREERAPRFSFPAARTAYDRLEEQLREREVLGESRFEGSVDANVRTRNLSNALFALVALLFSLAQLRLRRRLQEGRALVERLQRAFLSRRNDLPNVQLGSVLISATAGSEVGGDLHDVYALDDRFGSFLVADVSGKGIDAAVDTAFIKYSLRTLLSDSSDPGEVLTRFSKLYERNAESQDTFVVLFLGVIDTASGEVRYASAGHEPAWARFGQDVITLPPTGPLVGVIAGCSYETQTLHLRPGDALLVSTDGLTESRNARGEQLSASGVRAWFGEIGGEAQAMADAIVTRLRKRSRRIGDDLAILVVRYAPRQIEMVEVREPVLGAAG